MSVVFKEQIQRPRLVLPKSLLYMKYRWNFRISPFLTLDLYSENLAKIENDYPDVATPRVRPALSEQLKIEEGVRVIPCMVSSPRRNGYVQRLEGYNLESLSIPNGVEVISDGAFYNSKLLSSVTIPESVKYIGFSAFEGCSLDSIALPNSLEIIADDSFCGSKIKGIVIPDNVSSIGRCAFAGCKELKSVEMPDNVSSIGKGAFSYCSSLESITIPRKCNTLNPETFYNCTSLREITIPSTVVKFAAESPGYDYQGTFENCSNLERIIIEDGDRLLTNSQGSKLFEGVNVKKLYWGREISDASFRDCKTLVDLTFGPKVRTIPSSCFQGCDGLTEVFIPDGVTDTGTSTFNNCANLKNLYVGNGVQMLCSIVGSCGKFENLYIGNG